MYSNQCQAASGPLVGERQREVTAAIASAHGEFDALEVAVSNLLGRLEPLFNRNNKSESCDSLTPAYGSELGNRIGALTDRIEGLRRRVAQATSDIEV
jgi:hypothetical protein